MDCCNSQTTRTDLRSKLHVIRCNHPTFHLYLTSTRSAQIPKTGRKKSPLWFIKRSLGKMSMERHHYTHDVILVGIWTSHQKWTVLPHDDLPKAPASWFWFDSSSRRWLYKLFWSSRRARSFRDCHSCILKSATIYLCHNYQVTLIHILTDWPGRY
jgi:hypothetical protein